MSTQAPTRAPSAPAPRRSAPPAPQAPVAASPSEQPRPSKRFSVTSGVRRKAHRIVPYGTGGIGKTSLVALLKEIGLNPLFYDLEGGASDFDVNVARGIEDWSDLRTAIQDREFNAPYDCIVVDTASKAEELCAKHVISTIRTDSNGTVATSLESYGWGKGYSHLCEQFMLLLADLDRLYEDGKNIILVCHDCKANVPNPMGSDYIRFEPLLYTSKDGKASIRDRVKNWADHVLFIGYDVAANKDGKAKGGGSRQIYCQEQATFVAKSRTLTGPYGYAEGDVTIWKHLFGKE